MSCWCRNVLVWPGLVAAVLAVAPVQGQAPPAAGGQVSPERVRVRFDTALGPFEVELDPVRAPATVANFLKYVDGGFYDGGRVHRSARLDTQPTRPVKIEVIQAGINRARRAETFPAIPLERTSATGILHVDGTISMARAGPDTATSDFFICIGDQPSLDFGGARNPDGQGFAAFGRVVSGMDVVRAIHKAPAEGENLTPPVQIFRAVRVRADLERMAWGIAPADPGSVGVLSRAGCLDAAGKVRVLTYRDGDAVDKRPKAR